MCEIYAKKICFCFNTFELNKTNVILPHCKL